MFKNKSQSEDMVNSILLDKLSLIENKLISLQDSSARIESRQLIKRSPSSINDYEFKAYSQWGEDGIIQFLISKIPIKNKVFVEFGVENYLESNTRFLLTNNNWSGLVIDGSEDNIKAIKQSEIYWKHNLKALKAFVDAENINSLLSENGITGNIGLLSVDIDGNDYWVWKAINKIRPAIVIVEYNSRLGSSASKTIPYKKDFVRSQAHHSMIYFGASLKALYKLGKEKGYDLVGCLSSGVNAFFVKKELRPKSILAKTAKQAFVEGKFRETRDKNGELLYLDSLEEKKILEKLDFIEIK